MEFKEDLSSQIPALRMLINMGCKYLTPEEALQLRNGSTSRVVLEPILKAHLSESNSINFKGKEYAFSEGNINKAVNELTAYRSEGLIRDNERVYDLLTLGKSLEQTIDGHVKSHSLHYIDWQHPERNVYHVTDEYSVTRVHSSQTRRPDIVLFVNGIPLVVIECKRPDLKNALDEAVSQHLRNQREETEIPYLFTYAQILLGVCQNDAKYATCGTPKDFWSIWKEDLRHPTDEMYFQEQLERLTNQPLQQGDIAKIQCSREPENAPLIQKLCTMERMPSLQDKAIYSLLTPHRLLTMCYRYIVFDNQIKKIARYQQYFAIEATLRQVSSTRGDEARRGGIIWHTTGSGKSLTMVMLAKALALDENIRNAKVILVTDRVDLDTQIYKTFKACGIEVDKARTGEHLTQLVKKGSASVITSIIDKFETACNKKAKDESSNIFVLVDESHRTQYGTSHAKMKNVFPNACYLGFTGTPLTKKDKSTLKKFGNIIHDYSMEQAVKDGAVRPLVYEGRMSELHGDREKIDRWFDRLTEGMSDKQKADLKMKFNREDVCTQAEERMSEIAYDISRHYADFYKGTGLKAQFACSKKKTALQYKKLLDDFGLVTSEIIMSSPDSRKDNETIEEEDTPEIQAYWKRLIKKYGSEKKYVEGVTNAFKTGEEPEILIVVHKLLTGFDEPRNAVLYIDKQLKEHNLLQAIARVNRIYPGKDYGLIIDYRGIFGELNKAREMYAILEGFDSEDLKGNCIDLAEVMARLPQSYSNLWAIFNGVSNTDDPEEMQKHLTPEDRRDDFYRCLTQFAKDLHLAFSSSAFWQNADEKLVQKYKKTLKDFLNLRGAVLYRFNEAVCYQEYEAQIESMVHKYIGAEKVKVIIDRVSIFDIEDFDRELEKVDGDAAKADAIASRTKKSCREKMDENRAFYKRLSDLIEEVIINYRAKRLSEKEYLEKMRELMQQVQSEGRNDEMPSSLGNYKDAPAYYSEVKETLTPYGSETNSIAEISAQVAIKAEEIIESHKIRDWHSNVDVKNAILNDLEDHLFSIKGRHEIGVSMEEIDLLMDSLLKIAESRDRRGTN